MQVLLDTHLILWALQDDTKLPDEARRIILDDNNTIFYSSASVWEVLIKHQIKPDKMIVDGLKLSNYCRDAVFHMLPIRDEHVFRLNEIKNAPDHTDPFDRILICQAKEEGLTLVTHDKEIGNYNESFIRLVK